MRIVEEIPLEKPCPFCGGNASIRNHKLNNTDLFFELFCNHKDWCILENTTWHLDCITPEKLGEIWNRRVVKIDTGLTDKNGKPIREGDRVKCNDGMIGCVRFGLYRNAFNANADNLGFYVEWPDEYARKELPFWADKMEVVEENNAADRRNDVWPR